MEGFAESDIRIQDVYSQMEGNLSEVEGTADDAKVFVQGDVIDSYNENQKNDERTKADLAHSWIGINRLMQGGAEDDIKSDSVEVRDFYSQIEEHLSEVEGNADDKKVVVEGEVKDANYENKENKEKRKGDFIYPWMRIKRLMQVGAGETIQSDSVKMMMNATVSNIKEYFIEELVEKVARFSKSRNKKQIIMSDFLEAVRVHENLGFLKDSGILIESAKKSPKKLSQPPK